MVEVFKTNVRKIKESRLLIRKLLRHFPNATINFDLSDCDKILRAEGENLLTAEIIDLVSASGYQVESLQ
ncbi:MAG TPA: hypothetical protein VNV85_14005 [Puia sp.]|jgi:hypothetical protein|nr:hypothetical protein [Puia sp.]